ncbi:MAG: hypothetical protein ACK4ND_16390 [Cytophagaceae bacterium]
MNKAVLSILLAFLVLSCTEKDAIKEKIILGFALPEGTLADQGSIYISNVGKEFKPLDKDGDGFISKLTSDGEIVDMRFLPVRDTLHSPKGMGVANNVLYVTDIDRIKGYDLDSRKKVFDLDFSEEKTLLLNDITIKNDSILYVSAMDIDKVYEVNLSTPSFKEIISLKKPNGLYWDRPNEKLYVGMFGREEGGNGERGDIGVITFENDKATYTELSSHQGNIDGLHLKGNKLIFTDWLSRGEHGGIQILDLASGEISDLTEHQINGPGDLYYDSSKNRLWIPKMRENKVLMIQLD